MHVMIDPEFVTDKDRVALEVLGFTPTDQCTFQSYRYGSA